MITSTNKKDFIKLLKKKAEENNIKFQNKILSRSMVFSTETTKMTISLRNNIITIEPKLSLKEVTDNESLINRYKILFNDTISLLNSICIEEYSKISDTIIDISNIDKSILPLYMEIYAFTKFVVTENSDNKIHIALDKNGKYINGCRQFAFSGDFQGLIFTEISKYLSKNMLVLQTFMELNSRWTDFMVKKKKHRLSFLNYSDNEEPYIMITAVYLYLLGYEPSKILQVVNKKYSEFYKFTTDYINTHKIDTISSLIRFRRLANSHKIYTIRELYDYHASKLSRMNILMR